MGTRITLTSLVMATTVVVAQGAWAQLIIDDFSTGPYSKVLKHAGQDVDVQRGSMVGGRRLTEFTTIDGGFDQSGTLEILQGRPDGVPALTASMGIQAFHKVIVFYGLSRTRVVPLNLDLTPFDRFDRFRVTFDSNDLVLNFNMQVVAGNNPAPAQSGENLSANTDPFNPFCVDLPFSGFVPNAGELPDFGDIDQIRLIIQSGSALGSNDYAITRVEAVLETGVSRCQVI